MLLLECRCRTLVKHIFEQLVAASVARRMPQVRGIVDMLRPRPDCHTRQLCVRMLTGNVDVEFIAGNPVGKRGTAYGKRRPGFLACIHLAVACRRGIRLPLYHTIPPRHRDRHRFLQPPMSGIFRAMLGMVAFQDGDFRPSSATTSTPSRHQQRESGIQDFQQSAPALPGRTPWPHYEPIRRP